MNHANTASFLYTMVLFLASSWLPKQWAIAADAVFGDGPTAIRGPCDLQQLVKLIASDAAGNDFFGVSTAMSGDTLVVGARRDDHSGGTNAGSAYVFVRAGGVWTEQAKLAASDGSADEEFGRVVAISGDTIMVGVELDDLPGANDAGSVYVYVRSGSSWTQQAKLTANDAAGADHFGCTVAISGDTLVAGAFSDDYSGFTNPGSAYIFTRTGDVWTQQAKLIPSDVASGDSTGRGVAISGDTVVVGSMDDAGGFLFAGAAYVFVRSGSTWSEQAKLIRSDAPEDDWFGWMVAIEGDTIVVSAHQDDHAAGANAGTIYVFERSGSVWTEQAKLIASDAQASDSFGRSVALNGERLAVGTAVRSAYLFVRSGGEWTEADSVVSDAPTDDSFGDSVAISDEIMVVGASYDDEAGLDAGTAYVFALNCGDCDGDGVADSADNCPILANADQLDSDADGVGDACDTCSNTPAGLPVDHMGRPLRDSNGDCHVDGLDIQSFVDELLSQ